MFILMNLRRQPETAAIVQTNASFVCKELARLHRIEPLQVSGTQTILMGL